jgi:CHAD domain-containing protein
MRSNTRLERAVPPLVRKRLRKLLDGADEAVAAGRDDDLHALRIACKRLRYNVEFFRSVLEPHAQDALDLLALLQERLGSIADLDAVGRFYQNLLDGIAEQDPRAAGLSARLAAGRRDRERALEALRALWSESGGYPGRLTGAISAALGSLSPKDP